jgi:hypothetical protein
LRNALINFSY